LSAVDEWFGGEIALEEIKSPFAKPPKTTGNALPVVFDSGGTKGGIARPAHAPTRSGLAKNLKHSLDVGACPGGFSACDPGLFIFLSGAKGLLLSCDGASHRKPAVWRAYFRVDALSHWKPSNSVRSARDLAFAGLEACPGWQAERHQNTYA